MNFKTGITVFVSLLWLLACGEGVVEVKNAGYSPKIAVDGFLVPGQKVKNIHIFRNFKLDQDLNNVSFFPEFTTVTLTDDSNPANVYELNYNTPTLIDVDSLDLEDFYYEYNGNDLIIEHGKSYSLEVHTTIDGNELWTKSTTTIPQPGMQILGLNFQSLPFAAQKDNGDLEIFEITLQRSPGVTYYLGTVQPLDTTFNSLITNHLGGEIDKEMFEENFDEYIFDTTWIQNTPTYAGQSILRLFWFDFYFYSDYEVIIYAVDENYRKYLQTFKNTQEFDGNFHEAAFSFEGDGIGIFGSYIADTTYVTVTR